ncbi:amine oxidase [flavin-containing] A-like isoform X2 [Zootermopsis nevadensis]|uniref:Amine oxidase n=1 Tax=Zootermopsis nevadensis TaxID=136037 RepID=A0A067R2K0_ZOONE|nr:amine oxidase [flavin-containing] A-like isoform X2 [Zootermopsis nevadensis]KDR17146.1 Amine oxidase [flavin-containing] A [Zootermopsis nevadensis]
MSSKGAVIVIGAGLSGLSAAKLLHEHGVELVVLEASDRVGGRTLTQTPSEKAGDPHYGWVDLGASYVGPTQNHVLRLCRELGCETYLCRDNHDSIYFSKGKRCRYSNSWPTFWWSSPLAAWDLHATIRKLDNMALQVPADYPWQAPHAVQWDNITVKEFLKKHCWTRDAREFLEGMAVANNTAEDHEMSLLFFLWYLHQAQGVNHIWQAKGGAQERKIIGGSQQLSIKMAKNLGDRIHLKKVVVQIRHMNDGVVVKTLDGTVFNGSHVIMAIPPLAHLKIHFDPPLPSLRHGLIQRCPMGIVLKCTVFYKREFWVEKGYNGFVSCMDGIEVVGDVHEDQKPGISLYGLICFIFGQHAIQLKDMEQSARRDAICRSLANFYDSQEALESVYYVDKLWLEEPYIGGCYSSYCSPGVLTRFGPAIREPIGKRIYLAGTETALEWTGYMNGAIEAGERAAREVLHAQGKISRRDIWVKEPEFSGVSVKPLQPSWMETCQPNFETILTVSALIVGLLVALFEWIQSTIYSR